MSTSEPVVAVDPNSETTESNSVEASRQEVIFQQPLLPQHQLTIPSQINDKPPTMPSAKRNPASASRPQIHRRICRTCNTRRVKCSKVGPVCIACKMSGRECVWQEEEYIRVATEAATMLENTRAEIERVKASPENPTSLDRLKLLEGRQPSLSEKPDSSPLSSFGLSLLEEMESQYSYFDQETFEDVSVNDRKRKAEEIRSQLSDTDAEDLRENKRLRQELAVAEEFDDILAELDDGRVDIEMAEATEEGKMTLTSPSLNGHDIPAAISFVMEEGILIPTLPINFTAVPNIPAETLTSDNTVTEGSTLELTTSTDFTAKPNLAGDNVASDSTVTGKSTLGPTPPTNIAAEDGLPAGTRAEESTLMEASTLELTNIARWPKSPASNTLSTIAPLPNRPFSNIPIATLPPPTPPTLTPEQILLARIPSTTPLRPSTIAKACSWFEKMLTDDSGIDIMEIKEMLGVRIYRQEELPVYQRMKKEVAGELARRKALELAEVLEGDMTGNGTAGIGKEGWDDGNRMDETISRSAEQGLSTNLHGTSDSRVGHSQSSTDSETPYSLRLKLKPNFRANQHYSPDGRPRTEQARRKLEERDAAGDDSVVRVYDV